MSLKNSAVSNNVVRTNRMMFNAPNTAVGKIMTCASLDGLLEWKAVDVVAGSDRGIRAFLAGGTPITDDEAAQVGGGTGSGGYETFTQGDYAVVGGYQSQATGNRSVALGSAANSTAQVAVSVGYSLSARSIANVLVGNALIGHANSDGSVLIGSQNYSYSTYGVAIGVGTTIEENCSNSVSLGHLCGIQSPTMVNIGYNNTANDKSEGGVCIGNNLSNSGTIDGGGIAIGSNNDTFSDYAIAIGTSCVVDTTSNNFGGIAIGRYIAANGDRAIGIGYGDAIDNLSASGDYSIAIGSSEESPALNPPIASGDYSIAIGTQTAAVGEHGISVGFGAVSGGNNSICFGYDTTSTTGVGVVAIGNTVNCNGASSVVIGTQNNTNDATESVVIGSNCTIDVDTIAGGIVIGQYADITGERAISIGHGFGTDKITVSGNYGIAIGSGEDESPSSTQGGPAYVGSNYAIAIGTGSYVPVNAPSSVAIGHNATITNSALVFSDRGIAIGENASSDAKGGVAIGPYAVADAGCISIGAEAETIAPASLSLTLLSDVDSDAVAITQSHTLTIAINGNLFKIPLESIV